MLAQTFARLRALKAAGRNGIWPFVLRNLVRPVWLSRPDQRADVVIGNPPWVAYRHLSPEMKPRPRDACQDMDLWVGGVLATQQDLSALFWARSVERYLRPGGTIAFVLAYAALNRPAFAGFRRGSYGSASVRITAGWSLAPLREIFPNSACVLISRREAPGPLPAHVSQFSGTVRRDASEAEADRALRRKLAPWPPIATLEGASPYRARFKQGATIVPRRFFLVEREQAGRLRASRAAARVRGRQGPMDGQAAVESGAAARRSRRGAVSPAAPSRREHCAVSAARNGVGRGSSGRSSGATIRLTGRRSAPWTRSATSAPSSTATQCAPARDPQAIARLAGPAGFRQSRLGAADPGIRRHPRAAPGSCGGRSRCREHGERGRASPRRLPTQAPRDPRCARGHRSSGAQGSAGRQAVGRLTAANQAGAGQRGTTLR